MKKAPVYAGISFTKRTKLRILKRARKIISERENWTRGVLRVGSTKPKYCLLGGLEQACYELGLAEKGRTAFRGHSTRTNPINAYQLGKAISLRTYTEKKYGRTPSSLNDHHGHAKALEALDGYIAEVEAS